MELARSITTTSALGEDLVFRHLAGTEAVSRPFRFIVTLLAPRPDIAFEDILGTELSIGFPMAGGEMRYLSGLVGRFSYVGIDGGEKGNLVDHVYEAELRPWLWFLSRAQDCRIFQEMTAVEIIKKIFEKYDVAEVRDDLKGSYPARTYCVQYRESDLDFVHRLMEDEGIWYYFVHEDGKHTLVLADAVDSAEAMPGYDEVPFYPKEDLSRRERDHLYRWRATGRVRPGSYVHTAYDFEKPKADLQAKLMNPAAHPLAEGEIYDYPGGHVELAHGETIAETRLEERIAGYHRIEASGVARGIATGHVFALSNYPAEAQNTKYFVLEVAHELWGDPRFGHVPEEAEVYACKLLAQPADRPFRPLRKTPVPVVRGPQTAVVTGPSGQEIWTDKYGRVKVQFHWDRLGSKDDKSSCWVRVSQVWAGASFGAMHIPRIGQEVIVDFLEGDPDRPIITGRVYNAGQMPPWELPANATQSGIKSNSSKGGGGANEIRMEDLKGEEELYIHAQKNETIIVLNDKSETVQHDESIAIGNDRGEEVGHDEVMTVGNDRMRKVGHDEKIDIGNDRQDTVGGNEIRGVLKNQQQAVGINRNVTVGASQGHEIGANDAWTVGKDQSVGIGKNQSVEIGTSQTLKIGEDRTTTVGKTDGLSVGEDLLVDAGKKISIIAGEEISIVTGKASITMKEDGTITISGKDIKIEGSGKIDIKASKNITMKGKKILQN